MRHAVMPLAIRCACPCLPCHLQADLVARPSSRAQLRSTSCSPSTRAWRRRGRQMRQVRGAGAGQGELEAKLGCWGQAAPA